jgi:hypothetical protein
MGGAKLRLAAPETDSLTRQPIRPWLEVGADPAARR